MVSQKALSLYVKNVMVFEEQDHNQKTVLPFFADGYPGLIYYQAKNGLVVRPHDKKMPVFFLYGQTIKPVELFLTGSYKLVVMQLYPFVIKNFFRLDPRSINDNCFDLLQLDTEEIHSAIHKLNRTQDATDMVQIILDFLNTSFERRKAMLDYKIREAIQVILDNKGQIPITDVSKRLKINTRTFERRFATETGISPKQFSQITQFHYTLQQLSAKEFRRLTELVYASGFADQSHFNRVFKKFTGKTPKAFK